MAKKPTISRGGRPRTSPEGRGATLTITINPRIRAALEIAASQLDRSLSQTAEQAIERGRLLGELGSASVGIIDTVNLMLRYAAEGARREGDPDLSFAARDVLRDGWMKIARGALPAATDKLVREFNAVRYAALDAAEAVATYGFSDEFPGLEAQLLNLANGLVAGDHPAWREIGDELERVSQSAQGLLSGLVVGHLQIVLQRMALAELAAAEAGRHHTNVSLRSDMILRDVGFEAAE